MPETPSPGPLVSVIIINFNSGPRLARCIDALSRQTFRDFEVVVLDNASDDGSEEAARQRTRLIALDENTGFAKGNNLAAEQTSGALLAFLNPDAYPEPQWLEELVDAAQRHPGVDAFGSLQLMDDDPSLMDGAGDAYFFPGLPYRGGYGRPVAEAPGEGEIFAACGAGALYRRFAFKALGGFDESYFCYGEDVDLGFRLRLAGGRALHVPGAALRHEGSATSGRNSDFTIYHGYRNRTITFLKDMPLRILAIGLPIHLAVGAALVPVFAARGKLLPYAKALVHAFRKWPEINAQRRKLRKKRVASAGTIARALTWSPAKPLGRHPDTRPIRSRRPSP